MYSVSKTFSFCYGHRLLGDPGKCSRLHGHSAKVTITIAEENLDQAGMVCHFNTLKEKIGSWIDSSLDHKMILNKDDPLAKVLKAAGEEFVEVEFNPTAENLARFIYEYAKGKHLSVTEVEVWESETSKGVYSSRQQ